MKIERVMQRVYDRRRLNRAWQQVRKNAGAAGVDKMSVQQFEQKEQQLLELMHGKLQAGHYRFKPARRVRIPKPGTNKTRDLGIPVVMDRIVAVSIHMVLEEIFDPDFTPSNYGFRRGNSQHKAVEHLRQAIEAGNKWAVSIDLKSFFDEIPHGLILKLLRRKLSDESFITLIARELKAGAVVDGVFEKSDKGCPQGSPVSPILSNIVLNELDQELERRGHRYCRWADDFIILVKSPRAADRVMKGISRFLEQELGLLVNEEKSRTAPAREVEFLGFQVRQNKKQIGTKAKKRFKDKVRELTRRNNGNSMYQIVQRLNKYLKGWVGYFRIQQLRSIFGKLDTFIRNRLRSMQLKKWKKPEKFQRMMIKAGVPVSEAQTTWIRMRSWSSIKRIPVKRVLTVKWFRQKGLLFLDDYTQRNLELRFTR